jgi:hypothetical protein
MKKRLPVYNMPVNPMLPADFFLFMANTAQYLQATRWAQMKEKTNKYSKP